MTNDEYTNLKIEYLNRITENNTCNDADRIRKNIRKLREEIDERAERRVAGLKDLDSYADEQTTQRVLARAQFEKQALDEAIDDILVDGKLSFEREAFTKLSKATGVSRKAASNIQAATTGGIKFIVIQFACLCFCILVAPAVVHLAFSAFGIGALLLRGVFDDASSFAGVISYTIREVPAALMLIFWPFNDAMKAENIAFGFFGGLSGYVYYRDFFFELGGGEQRPRRDNQRR